MAEEKEVAGGKIAAKDRIQLPADVKRHLQKRFKKPLDKGDRVSWVINKDGDAVLRPA